MIDTSIGILDLLQTSAKDMEIEKFYDRFGENITLRGGIDVQETLTAGTEKEVRQEVNKIKNLWEKKYNYRSFTWNIARNFY